MTRLFALLFGILLLGAAPTLAQEQKPEVQLDPENTLFVQTDTGQLVIQMFPDKAPKHVKRVKELVRDGFYDGIIFHRVINGFMAQTGDPTGTGTGGSGRGRLKAEFNDVPHTRGVVSMARAQSPDSADSQFFIMLADAPPGLPSWSQLDGNYTVWGRVIEGMEAVDRIQKGEPPANPSRIIKAAVVIDVLREQAEKTGQPVPGTEPRKFGNAGNVDILSPVLKNPDKR